MEIISNVSLPYFQFWSGARDNASKLSYSELETLESLLEDLGETMTETQLNDLLWFDFELVCEWLGLDYNEVMERK